MSAIADLFQGALPESEVKRFVEALLKMSGGTMPAADGTMCTVNMMTLMCTGGVCM